MARARKNDTNPKTITRKVFFYKVNAGVSPDTGQPVKLNFSPAVQHLATLPFTSDGRYLATEDGKELCCWPDSLQTPFRFRLANIRRGQHPPVESEGNFSPLILGAGRGLAEITHLVLFADGTCGAEFNFYGPRASQLSFYFALKLNALCQGFRLAVIMRPDLEARLAAIGDLKMIDLKMRASSASLMRQANDDLGAAFEANIRAVNARPEDELSFGFTRKKGKRYTPRAIGQEFLDGIRRLARMPSLKEQVSIFKVQGTGGKAEVVDILHEQFVAEKHIQPAANEQGGVDSDSMYAAIEQAYAEMQVQLSEASTLE